LKYSYSNADLLEFPQKYQMTPFEGREFLSSYEQSRKDVLDKIKNNQAVNSLSQTLELIKKSSSTNEKENKKIFVTNDLLLSILLKLESKEETQQETKMIMMLLKKFEIKKKIFTEYDYDFSKYDSKLKENSTDFKILRNYILFAAICIQKFQDNNNLKFLNVLLKLNDIICSQIDSISDAHDLSLVYHVINLELEYVSDLNRKTL
jgi:hypothetical protein